MAHFRQNWTKYGSTAPVDRFDADRRYFVERRCNVERKNQVGRSKFMEQCKLKTAFPQSTLDVLWILIRGFHLITKVC